MQLGNASAEAFAAFENMDLPLAMDDPGTGDWRAEWVVDGERADLRNTPRGMVFAAGPIPQDHACHAVLWTRKRFTGNLKIEFEFTRLDTVNRYVNILYLHAQGVGGQWAPDIHTWSDQRAIPYMKTYFENMQLLHLSYAAFGNDNDEDDNYLRVRRYPVTPERGFRDIEVDPTIVKTGCFQPGVPHHMCVVKTADKLALRIRTDAGALHHIWDTTAVAPPQSGPVGIRHMWTKCSRYRMIRIYSEG